VIELLALSKTDGWAIIRSERGLQLLRPPYTETQCPMIQDVDAARLLAEPGFNALTEKIVKPDLGGIIAHIKETTAKTVGPEQVAQVREAARQLLIDAPPDRIRHSLRRVRTEFLPQCQFDPALRVLSILAGSKAAMADPQLQTEILKLLEESVSLQQQNKSEKRKTDRANFFKKISRLAGFFEAGTSRIFQPG